MKKTLILLLSLLMCFNSTMIVTHAEEINSDEGQLVFIEEGNVNNDVTFTIDETGLITYFGEGTIDKRIAEYCTNYSSISKVFLTNKITDVVDNAFDVLNDDVIYEISEDNNYIFINENGIITKINQDINNDEEINEDVQDEENNNVPLLSTIDKLEVPNDVSVSFNPTIGLIIESENKDYLQATETCHLINDDNIFSIEYDNDNQYVFIGVDKFVEASILFGVYDGVVVQSNGYEELLLESSIMISIMLQASPIVFTVRYDSSKGLVVEDVNEKYQNLYALTISIDGKEYYYDIYSGSLIIDDDCAYAPQWVIDMQLAYGKIEYVKYHLQNTEPIYDDDIDVIVEVSYKNVPYDLTITEDYDTGELYVSSSSDQEYINSFIENGFINIYTGLCSATGYAMESITGAPVASGQLGFGEIASGEGFHSRYYGRINGSDCIETSGKAIVPFDITRHLDFEDQYIYVQIFNNDYFSPFYKINYKHRNLPGDLLVKQDQLTGDLIISTNNNDYLTELMNGTINLYLNNKNGYSLTNSTTGAPIASGEGIDNYYGGTFSSEDMIREGNTIKILYKYLRNFGLESQNVYVQLMVKGYYNPWYKIAYKNFPVPSDLKASQNSTSKDIIITSTDSKYLNEIIDGYIDLYIPTRYGQSSTVTGAPVNYIGTIQGYDLKLNKNQITIPYNYVHEITNSYNLYLVMHTENYDASWYKVVFKLKPVPSDIAFSFDSNIGLIIKSSNKEFLKELNEVCLAHYTGSKYNYYYFEKECISYNYTDSYAYIPKNVLYSRGASSKTYFWFELSYGCDSTGWMESPGVYINGLNYPPGDSEIEVEYNNELQRIIFYAPSYYQDYLKKIDYVYFYKDNGYDCAYAYSVKYDETEQYAYISQNEIDRYIPTGAYRSLEIYSDGYYTCNLFNRNIEVISNLKVTPKDVQVYFDPSIGIVITSDDKDFLYDISQFELYTQSYIEREPHYYDYFYEICFDDVNEYAFISLEQLNKSSICEGTYHVSIYNNNYNQSVEIHDIVVNISKPDVADEIMIYYDDEQGLIIDSNNKHCLKRIAGIEMFDSLEPYYVDQNFNSRYIHQQDIHYDSNNRYSVIDKSVFTQGDRFDGFSLQDINHFIIYFNEYNPAEIDKNISISFYKKNKAPSDVDYLYSQTEGLKITSKNAEYLSSIKEIKIDYSRDLEENCYYVSDYSFTYDATKNCILIPQSFLKNVSTNYVITDITLFNDDYDERKLKNLEISVSGLQKLPSNITFEFDNSVGLIIKCSNTTYLKNITFVSMEIEYGNGDSEYSGFYPTYDAAKKYAYISIDDLKENSTYGNVVNINISSTNYEYSNISTSINIPSYLVLFPEDIVISHNINEGIKIESDDKEFLRGIQKVFLEETGDCFYDICYNEIYEYAYIPQSTIDAYEVVTRTYNILTIKSKNYETYRTEEANINISTSWLMYPNDISIEYINGIGLIINSFDKEYLKSIQYINVFINSNNYDFSSDNLFNVSYDTNNEYVVVNQEKLDKSSLLSDDYSYFVINANNYERYRSYETINITTSVKPYPKDVYFTEEDDKVIVHSSNTEYLNSLTKANAILKTASEIEIYINNLPIYRLNDGKVYIKEKDIDRNLTYMISQYFFDNLNSNRFLIDTISFNTDVNHYANKNYELKLSFTSKLIKQLPLDITLNYDNTKGLIIKSSNQDYLENIYNIYMYNDFGSGSNMDGSIHYDYLNKYVYVDKQFIETHFISNKYTDISICSVGYPSYSYEKSLTINSTITKAPQVNVVKISESKFAITSPNTDYLQTVERIVAGYDDNGNGSGTVDYTKEIFNYDSINKRIVLSSPYEKLNFIYLFSDEYAVNCNRFSNIYFNDVEEEKEIPSDVEIKYENSELSIYSDDDLFLDNIIRINISNSMSNIDDYFYSNRLEYDIPNHRVYVPSIYLDDYILQSCNKISIDSIEYKYKEFNDEIVLSNATYAINDRVKLSYDDDIGIVIESSNLNLLEQLSSIELYSYKLNCQYDANKQVSIVPLSEIYEKMNFGIYDLFYVTLFVGDKYVHIDNYVVDENGSITEYDKFFINSDSYKEHKGIENEYFIKYVLNGGENNSLNPSSYVASTGSISLKDPSRENYIFRGWYLDSSYTRKITSINKTNKTDVTLYALWAKEYNINYHLNGGINNSSNPYSYYSDSSSFIFKDPTKEGYSFLGWYSDNGFSNRITKYNKGDEGDIDLYAKWALNHAITYVLDGGNNNANNPNIYYEGQSFTLGTPQKLNCSFGGWYEDSTFTTPISEITSDFTRDLTLFAKWEPIIYTVVFDKNSDFATGTMTNQVFTRGVSTKVNPNEFARPGYVFDGWKYINDVGKTITVKDNASIKDITQEENGIVTFVAQWKQIPYYTIKYNLNGGTQQKDVVIPTKYTYAEGSSDELELPIPTRLGYIFTGWHKNSIEGELINGSYNDGENQTISFASYENFNLYASWQPIAYTILLKNDVNNESISIDAEYGDSFVLDSSVFNIPGFKFDGWTGVVNGKVVNYKDKYSLKNATTTNNEIIVLTAKWTATTYTIKYNLNKGTNPKGVLTSYVYGSTIDLPVPTRKGYIFKGWSETSNESNTITQILETENRNIVLYALWEEDANTYTITYTNEGDYELPSGKSNQYSYTVTDAFALVNPINIEGYKFIGYYDSNNTKVTKITKGSAGDLELTAIFEPIKYNISFNSNGGKGSMTQIKNVEYDGGDIDLPTNTFTKPGYIFVGWSTNKKDVDPMYSDEGTIEENLLNRAGTVTLYAIWELDEDEYYISYDENGGEFKEGIELIESYYPSDNTFKLPIPIPPESGQKFIAWFDQDGKKLTSITKGSQKNYELTAYYTNNEYSISYDEDGGELPNNKTNIETYISGKSYSLIGPVKQGYKFMGWYNQYGTKVSSINSNCVGDLSLTAVYEPIKYNVSFNANGGKGSIAQIKNIEYDNENIELPTNVYTRDGYSFLGWSSDKKASSADYYDEEIITDHLLLKAGTVTLYAVWEANTYTISFDSGSGGVQETMNDFECTYGVSYKLPECEFVNPGYKFNGWTGVVNGKVVNYKDSASIKNLALEGNIILTAKWVSTLYTIKYNLNKGTNPKGSPTGYGYGSNITLPIPTRKGYSFGGWLSDPNNENSIVETIEPTDSKDYSLTALWSIDTYNIGYYGITNDEKESLDNIEEYNVETATYTLKNPSRNGYTFNGWYKENTYKTKLTSIKKGSVGNLELYAKWTPITYKITYNLNGGKNDADNPKTYTIEDSTITLQIPIKNGYSFLGWYSDSKFNNKVTEIDTSELKNVVLYAKWEKFIGPIVLTMAEVNPLDGTICGAMDMAFKEKVEELSGGQIKIDLQGGGVLGIEADILDGMVSKTGTVDICRISAFALTSYGTKKAKLLSLPYTFRDKDHFWAFADSELGQEFLDESMEIGLGIKSLYYGEEGFRNFFSVSEKVIETPSDCSGLKIRVSNDPVMVGMAENLGGIVTPVSMAEVYQSLQNGIIDAAEQPTANYLANSFQETGPNLTLDGHTIGAMMTVITEKAWNKLNAQQKEWIKEASKYASQVCREQSEAKENAALEELRSQGVNIIEVIDKTPWLEACENVINENISNDLRETYNQIINLKSYPNEKKIGVAIYQFNDNFMTLYRNNIQAYFDKLNAADSSVHYSVEIVDSKNDPVKQSEQINTFIAQGVDALIVNLVQPSTIETVQDAAEAANIPVVFINREPEDNEAHTYGKNQCYVGAKAQQSGTFQGEIVYDLPDHGDLNGNGTVDYVMIMGDVDNTDAQYRTEFSIGYLTDNGVAVNKLVQESGNWDQAQGQEIAANALSQYGNAIDVIFCNNDGMALGAYQAIVAAGRTVGEDIYLLGIDALDECVEMVNNRTMTGTVMNDCEGQANAACDSVVAYLKGQTVETYQYIPYLKIVKK